mmetsp:Transcript_21241/g.34321  ORF Transcript_21241/g.34321 Transcript_21241/m.34321 type:complete len:256 (-) Transcript_21241:751-1518(-)
MLRDLRHQFARVALTPDDDDGSVGKRRRRLVAACRTHVRHCLPRTDGGGGGGVQLEHRGMERVSGKLPLGIVESADGVNTGARGSTRDVAARLGEVGGGAPYWGGGGRVHHLHGLELLVGGVVAGNDVNLTARRGGARVGAADGSLRAIAPHLGGNVVDERGGELGGAVFGKAVDDVDLVVKDGGAEAHARCRHGGQHGVCLEQRVVLSERVEPASGSVLPPDQVDHVAGCDSLEVRCGFEKLLLGCPESRASVE